VLQTKQAMFHLYRLTWTNLTEIYKGVLFVY